MRRIWDTSEIGRNMKVQLLKTNKLDGFQCKYMKRILRKRLHLTISHQQIQENTGVNRTSDEIRRRRCNWIGHIMRKVK